MWGWLNALIGRAEAQTAPDAVQSLRDDASLGPALVDLLLARPDVAGAVYDAQRDMIRIQPASGQDRTLYLDNLRGVIRTGQLDQDYLDALLAPAAEVAPDAFLLPMLKPADFAQSAREAMRQAGATDDQIDEAQPVCLDYAEGLSLCLVFDMPDRIMHLTPPDQLNLGLDAAALTGRAQDQFADWLAIHPYRWDETDWPGVQALRLDGNYDASLAALPQVWADAAERLGGRPAVAFIARNIVLVANSQDAVGMAGLRQAATGWPDDLPYTIAPNRIYIHTDTGGWAPLDD